MEENLLTWNHFLKDARKLVEKSNEIGDRWKLVSLTTKTPEELGQIYVNYEHKVLVILNGTKPEIIQLEYDIVYSISYQVPVIYFNGLRSDGSRLKLEDAWQIFQHELPISSDSKELLLNALSQTEHPLKFTPYLLLHPCKTEEILRLTKTSKNLLVSFLSLYGPCIYLKLKNDYFQCTLDEKKD